MRSEGAVQTEAQCAEKDQSLKNDNLRQGRQAGKRTDDDQRALPDGDR